MLLTANAPAFQRFLDHTGTHERKRRALPGVVADAEHTLLQLGRLFPAGLGEACFSDRHGVQIARVAEGQVSPRHLLSAHEHDDDPTVRAALDLAPGEVHEGRPYVSPDMGRPVIPIGTVVRTRDGAKHGVVHLEATLEGYRREAVTSEGNYEVGMARQLRDRW